MAQSHLFDLLQRCSTLGSPGKNSIECVEKLVKILKEDLLECRKSSESVPQDVTEKEELASTIHDSVEKLLSNVDDVTKSDIRIVCGCHLMAILHEILIILDSLPSNTHVVNQEEFCRKKTENPPASPSLISVQQTQVVEDALRIVIYTVILGCLSQEASQYVKVMIARNKFVLGPDLVSVSQTCRHGLLVSTMKVILSILKHPSLGIPLRGPLFPEILCALLELCFAPGKLKDYPKDTAFFREQLEEVLSARDTNQTLQHLLLLKGVAKNGVWMQKVCGSLLVRRYLMQPGGVASVIGAGLSICDGQDWKRCEAVAALVAHAKFPNIDLYYSTVGPQISELMLTASLKPEVLRVVMLVVSEMAQRSATLTSLHITNPVMQPLLNLTNCHTESDSVNSSLTLCVTRIHKLFVEIGIPSTTLMSLLHSVIVPLMAVAAFPTSHLRSLAQQCIVRYLTQQPTETVIEILLHISRLQLVSTVPTINEDVTLSLDEEGGIRICVTEASSQTNVLENDENTVKAIVSVLETLKNPLIVRSFYEKLVLFIDFSILNKRKMSPAVLMTDDDVRAEQFEAVRRVHICCSLLSHLADSEQLTNDLFQNLSAAVPIVDTLLRTSCQICDDEALDKTKVSFIMNVVMMVSCYVNEQMMRKKMCSDDWKGLKSLLPSLEEIKKNVTDEGVLLFVEQLRNIVLTHGVIKTLPGEVGETLKAEKQSGLKSVSMVNSPPKSVSSDRSDLSSKINLGSKSEDKSFKMSRNEEKKNGQTNTDDLGGQKSTYKEAMEDIVSPVVPIRGHAILALGKLIEERDCETLSHKEQLLALFQHNLKEEDSYLYLMAIQGLAALCDAYPDKVVETLTQEFSIGNRTAEDRAKLAEVLARASKRLGPILPRYSSHFMNSLLAGVRDTEAIVRASSLSSLGEVCKILRFSLGSIIYEVLAVLQAVLDGDKAVEVRRAAILVVTLILQGLGRDAFSVLKDVIRDLYRVLRLVHARDPDDVVRLHTQLAIEEIDTITKEFLLPKLNLTKRIFVADLPPNQF